MKIPIHISDDVKRKAHEDHLLVLLEDALDIAARDEARAYYPEGSLLAFFPSDADLEKARATVVDEARKTDFTNLVPRGSGLRPIFEKKEALHQSFLSEAIANIQANAQRIGAELLDGVVPTSILSLNSDGADAHNGARHTMVVETDAGAFLYKPRSLKADAVIRSLCDDLFPGMFCVPRAIDCGDFGFSEFIEAAGPTGSDELDGYFEALGTFCALSHFLSLSDQHAENFLACGSQLAPLDLETMLATAFKLTRNGSNPAMLAPSWKGSVGGDCFSHDMARSITGTGMLTCKQGNLFGAILAGTRNKIEPIDSSHQTLDHKHQIIRGFKQGYETCLANKGRLREAVESLKGTRLRVLLEATMFYHLLLKRLYNASTWSTSDGAEKVESSLRMTGRAAFDDAILKSEAESLLQGDYPAFYFIPEEKCLYDGSGIIDADYLGESPLDVALDRIASFDEKDMQFQLRVLEKAIDDMPLMCEEKPISLKLSRRPLTPEAALAEASHLLELSYEDIVQGEGSKGGLWVARYGETHKSAMDCSLATGYAGVGIFAAACIAAHVENAHRAERLLDICLHELDCHMSVMLDAAAQATRLNVGLADGIGGIAQALQHIWSYAKDQRVPNIYAKILSVVDAADIATMQGSNVYNGLAGLLLPLANEVHGLPTCACVERIANELMNRASTDASGHRVWTEQDGVSGEVGYGKGTGGIGLALLHAWKATDDERFWDACCDAIAYEDAHYNEELGFWPLVVQTRKQVSPPGICRGASGQAIVFTQAAQAGVPMAQGNAGRARICALALPVEPNDNLCCGTSAIVEGLITLGCEQEAGIILRAQVERSKQLGYYVSENTRRAPYFNPSLLYGCLGVGYELLRYASPEAIKSIFA